jgi:hypothetical protein
VIRWVYITEIVIYDSFCTSFPLYFLCVCLISEKLVSEYEQLLTLTDIAVSTLNSLKVAACLHLFQKNKKKKLLLVLARPGWDLCTFCLLAAIKGPWFVIKFKI